jgi:hypothetical protein
VSREEVVVYRCSICGATYPPDQAIDLGFHCHAPLERSTSRGIWEGTGSAEAAAGGMTATPYVPLELPEGQVAVQAIPPAQNEVDPTVVEQILGSMTDGPLSLELAGDAEGQRMFLRGPEPVVRHAQAQLQAGYGQVAFRPLPPEEDPVQQGGRVVASASCTLRRPPYFPLRTWRQFGGTDDLAQVRYQGPVKVADPIRVLVGALDGLQEGERALVQVVLVRRAPEDWADPYQGAAQQVDFRVRAASPAGQARGALLAGGMVLAFLGLVFLCRAAAALARHGLSWQAMGPLAVLGFLATASAAAGYGIFLGWQRLTTILNANPLVVRQKVSQPAFHVQIRFWAWAETAERAQEVLRRMLSAYAVFNLAEGNGLVPTDRRPVHPVVLADEDVPTMLLNLTEIAGMWHMPMGELPERMGRQMFFRRVPQEITRPTEGAVHVGHSTKGGDPVYLPYVAVEAGMFIVGKPQVGKSTFMETIAEPAMRDPGRALVVIDPHQDMVRRLMGLVPPTRLDDVRCLDLAETGAFPGINLLDMTLGVPVDKVVSDLIVVGKALWSEYWGPRMEQVLRYAALTIALVNRRRVAEGHPERQLGVLFIPRLLLANSRRREAYLLANLPPAGDPVIDDVLWWWKYYYDAQRTALVQQVISPVITKIYHLSGVESLRNVFGQARTTVDFRRVIREAGIVLVNTGGATLGQDVGAFVGALFLNYLDAVTREQGALPRDRRVPITVVVDEFQSIRGGVSWRDFLGQLRKFGAHVILGTQSLAGMREDNRELPGEILAGVMTVVAFQVNAEDARYLQHEFDLSVPPTSMTNLPPYHAYVKTIGPDRSRLPTLEVRLRPPSEPDPAVVAMVRRRMASYTRPAEEVEVDLRRMEEEPVDEYDAARAQDAALRSRLAEGQQVLTADDLLAAARAMGTRSTQNYGPRSGSVGRGLKTRLGRRRPGAVGGYRVASG